MYMFVIMTYQWRKAFLRNMEVNCSATRFQTSWMAVELPTNVVDILSPFGGTSQIEAFTLFGIHSTKYDESLFTTLSICITERRKYYVKSGLSSSS